MSKFLVVCHCGREGQLSCHNRYVCFKITPFILRWRGQGWGLRGACFTLLPILTTEVLGNRVCYLPLVTERISAGNVCTQ